MKKISVMFVLLLMAVVVSAQRQTENNRKGDEAMKSLDYSSAKIWYEEGVVSHCDPYSIDKLTTIWLADSSMHAIMSGVMSRCLACLDGRATQSNDTASVILLIKYYSEGIGTYKNETKADMWKSRLEDIRNPYQASYAQYAQKDNRVRRDPVKMDIFVGYAATLEAPFGLTVGGVGRNIGWYLRFRSNMSFQSFNKTFEMDGYGEPVIIEGLNDGLPDFSGKSKTNTYIGTGGIVIKVEPSFYVSVGAGYAKREFLIEYNKIGVVVADYDPTGPFWAKYAGRTSFDGVAIDLDGTLKMGKSFYGSLGFSVLDFNYISANVGFGVFF